MNKRQLVLDILKYTLFVLIALILFLIWKVVFIVQGGIGLEGNLLLLPIKLLPIILYSTFAFWLTLKMFDYKKKVSQKRNISFAFGAIALVLSIAFQHFSISKRVAPFKFKNEMFFHLSPIKVANNFKNRLILSSAEYSRLIPLKSIDGDSISYIANAAAEAILIFELKKLVDDRNIKNTCREYIKAYGDHNNCITDFQKDVYSHYQFSSTGNILLVAVGALGTFKIKELMAKQYGKKNQYIFVKSINDIIETSLLSAQKSKNIILTNNKSHMFSMGHELRSSSVQTTIERQINYKFLITVTDKIAGLIQKVDEKTLSAKKINQKREISSITRPKLVNETLRFKNLKAQFLAYQSGGFKVEDLKKKQKEMDEEMESKLNQLKEESLIFKIAAFFDNSLFQLTVNDLFKKNPEPKPEKKKSI